MSDREDPERQQVEGEEEEEEEEESDESDDDEEEEEDDDEYDDPEGFVDDITDEGECKALYPGVYT